MIKQSPDEEKKYIVNCVRVSEKQGDYYLLATNKGELYYSNLRAGEEEFNLIEVYQ